MGFFVDIGPKLAQSFNSDWVDEVEVELVNDMDPLSVTEEILRDIINDINVHKSAAIDNVSARVLKDAFTVFIPQLLYMYNQCFRLNIYWT